MKLSRRKQLLDGLVITDDMVNEITTIGATITQPPKPPDTSENRLFCFIRDKLPLWNELGWTNEMVARHIAQNATTITEETLLAVISKARGRTTATGQVNGKRAKTDPANGRTKTADISTKTKIARKSVKPTQGVAANVQVTRASNPSNGARSQASNLAAKDISSETDPTDGRSEDQPPSTSALEPATRVDAEPAISGLSAPARVALSRQAEAASRTSLGSETTEEDDHLTSTLKAPDERLMDTARDVDQPGGSFKEETDRGKQLDLIPKPKDKHSE